MNKLYTAVLTTPGPIISFTQLNYKGLFRRHNVNNQTGKQLMLRVVEEISTLELGHVETFIIPGNKSQVYFFKKKNIPEDRGEAMEFAKKLAAIGLSLPKYQAAYTQANEESDKHNEDYENRKNGVPATSSPRKRPRVDEISAED